MFKPESESLVERCRSGDEEAVSFLVKDNQAALFRLALSILDDPAEADEATQETFLAALRNLGSYRGGASLLAELRTRMQAGLDVLGQELSARRAPRRHPNPLWSRNGNHNGGLAGDDEAALQSPQGMPDPVEIEPGPQL